MFDLEKITRKNIEQLTAYSSARDEFTGTSGVFLDANENPFGMMNRYPDPYQKELKNELFKANGMNPKNTFVGNGSDEVIDILFRIFCNPSVDKALTFTPTYGMYEVCAGINDVELINVQLNDEFDIDFEAIEDLISDPSLKLILICSPNNPTGNCPNTEIVEKIIKNFQGIVFIDEAYINFSTNKSFTHLIDQYPNLVIGQTMSKAWGLAAARIGFAFGNSKIIDLFNKIKPPYNISYLNQSAAIETIKRKEDFERNKKQILENKEKLFNTLIKLDIVEKIYPSETNFFLIEFQNSEQVFESLLEKKIIVRNRNKIVKNCIRITVGSEQENQLLIEALKSISI